MPFSICCSYCDAGSNITSQDQAVAEGWIEIEPDDGLSWNYLGVCPACQPQHEADILPPHHLQDGQ